MSTTAGTVRIPAVCTSDRRRSAYSEPVRHDAQVGWVTGTGPTKTAALDDARDRIVAGIVDWKRPELVQHNGRYAIIYTRPDGGSGYDLYREDGAVACTSTVAAPNGQSGAQAEWQATVKAAWHSVVQAATDWADDEQVWSGWRALSRAGHNDLAEGHLTYAGWQRAYAGWLGRSADQPATTDGRTEQARQYATEHAAEHIPTHPGPVTP